MAKQYWKTDTTRVYRDIDLNFNQNPITNDVTSVTEFNAVQRSMKNLLHTNHYDKPFHPEIGSAIQHLLFEDYGPITANRLKRAIEEVIGGWEHRVRIIKIDCSPFEDSNDYEITIHFYVENLPSELQQLQTVLETVR